MSFSAVEDIARAVLYEGYLLYPYRLSAVKNRYRSLLGRLVPRQFSLAHSQSEPWTMTVECLVRGTAQTAVAWQLRFLQLATGGDGRPADAGCDTVERQVTASVTLGEAVQRLCRVPFNFERLEGAVTVSAAPAGEGIFKLTTVIENVTPGMSDVDLDQALAGALLSTHMIFRVDDGVFLSSIDPPPACREAAAACRSSGLWPVLIGPDAGQMLLAAPIILYDYPQVAPESSGDLFDGTEIDELLALRIRTLTPDEKRQMAASGSATLAALERAESLTEDQLLQLHGRWSRPPATRNDFQRGDRVRLRPHKRADALDMLVRGETATVAAVERDYEGRIYLCVILDNDPGRDFGEQGLPGHRFFFGPEEVERL